MLMMKRARRKTIFTENGLSTKWHGSFLIATCPMDGCDWRSPGPGQEGGWISEHTRLAAIRAHLKSAHRGW